MANTTPQAHELPELWRKEARDIRDRGLTCTYNSIFARADELEAALKASPVQTEAVGDWVMVPREPTEAMIEIICDRHAGKSIWPDDYGNSAQAIRRRQARDGYRAMLAAAPSAPAEAVQAAPEPLAQGEAALPKPIHVDVGIDRTDEYYSVDQMVAMYERGWRDRANFVQKENAHD